jgi:F420-dependent oxidoreductase-like protein
VTRLGYLIPNFTYPGVAPARLFAAVRQQALEADASGFDTVMVMDHFYQLPAMGTPDQEMLECYTLLSALAQHTSRVRLSSLVTGNTYRRPSLLAKTITALDIVSDGRAQLAIGAGWFEFEHQSLGFEFGTFTDRFEKLEESLQIVVPMLRGEKPTFSGKWYQVREAMNVPAALSRIPVMIGGSGERKTLRLVARYADESNLTCTPQEIPRKLDALAAHCADLGRDRSQITVSIYATACIASTHEQAIADLHNYIKRQPQAAGSRDIVIVGDPDEVAEQFARLRETGIDGVTISAPANAHVEGRVDLLGHTLAPLFTT